MALLAEELVEEWLNRQGYFTIRGVKLGVHEIDLLAIRPAGVKLECRQIEVQASVLPTRLTSCAWALLVRTAYGTEIIVAGANES